MKYIVLVGPDILGIESKNKANIKSSLTKSASRFKAPKGLLNKEGHLGCKFKGKSYTKSELLEAHVLTLNEFWKAYAVFKRMVNS